MHAWRMNSWRGEDGYSEVSGGETGGDAGGETELFFICLAFLQHRIVSDAPNPLSAPRGFKQTPPPLSFSSCLLPSAC